MESKHHPHGNAVAHYDSQQIERLIAQYQQNRDVATLSSIVALSEPRALTLIRTFRTTKYKATDELLSDINYRLIKAVDKFDPAKGSAFTFVSQVIANVLFSSASAARKDNDRYTELTKGILTQLRDSPEDRTLLDDIRHKIKAGARTTLSEETELSVQRWFIDSFTDTRFESRRHECANAAMVLFPSLSHGRSRELYDLSMLEVRRVLYDAVSGRRPIVPGRLVGSRMGWMVRYTALMSAAEFTKFAVLMKDLAPYLLLLVAQKDRNRRTDRSPGVGRRNIELILDGDPDAVLLFKNGISLDKEPMQADSDRL